MTADTLVRPSGMRLTLALVAAVGLAAGSGLLAAALARVVAPDWAADPQHTAVLVIAVVYAAVITALLLVLGRTPQRRRDWLGLRPVGGRQYGLGLAAWVAAYALAAACYLLLSPIGPSPAEAADFALSVGADNGRLHDASGATLVLILVRYLVLSPFGEELLFRGALFSWLRSRLSARWTILLTGIGFGLMHQSPTFLPLAIIVGLAAGWIRERTGSTYVPIAVHAVQNAVFLSLSWLITGWDTPAVLG